MVESSIPGVLSFFSKYRFCFLLFFVRHRVWFHNRAPLRAGPDISEFYCCSTCSYFEVYTWHEFMHAESAAAAWRVIIILLLLQLAAVLLAAAVRHRVPDGKNCCCGSLNLIPALSFSFNSN